MVLHRVTNRPVRGEDLLRDAIGILACVGEDRREHSAERGQTNSLEAADTPQCSCMSVFEPLDALADCSAYWQPISYLSTKRNINVSLVARAGSKALPGPVWSPSFRGTCHLSCYIA